MGRLFSVALICCMLLLSAHGRGDVAQPVFFSLLFPQMIPQDWLESDWLTDWLWWTGRAVTL